MKEKLSHHGIISILFPVIIFILAGSSFAQESANAEEIIKLKDQINKLEMKVNEQSETIKKLQKEISGLKSQGPLLAIPKSGDIKSLPKGSRPFYFNGQTYYIVPLDNKQKLMDDNTPENK